MFCVFDEEDGNLAWTHLAARNVSCYAQQEGVTVGLNEDLTACGGDGGQKGPHLRLGIGMKVYLWFLNSKDCAARCSAVQYMPNACNKYWQGLAHSEADVTNVVF